MAYRRDSTDFANERGLKDLATKSLYIQSKKFYIDIKESKRGRFLKLSEVAPNGQKMRILMDLSTGKEFHDRLSEFCEVYSNLGPSRPEGSYHNDNNLKSETIFKEDRRYYLDLKENHRGRFLKVSMSLPNHERTQVVIPAHGMIDIRDALTDLLNEFGKDEKRPILFYTFPGCWNEEMPHFPHRQQTVKKRQTLSVDNKNFHFDLGSNTRGNFLRISEVSGTFKATITIPEDAWDQFVCAVEEATESTSDEPDVMIIN